MSIKLFFEISKEFFDSIYSQGIDDDNDDDNNDFIYKKKDEEKGIDDDEELCYYNVSFVSRQLLSFMNKSDL